MDRIIPSKEKFLLEVRSGAVMPLAVELDAPGLTPLAALEALRTAGHAVLLESARVNDRIGRYSFVTADPYLVFKSRGDEVELILPQTPAGKYGRRAATRRQPLLKLRELLNNYRTARVSGLPPFTGGAVGFFSYDFVHQLESLPRTAVADLDIPEAYFVFVDLVVAFDHVQNRRWVIVNPGAREQELGFRRPGPGEWAGLYDRAAERLAWHDRKTRCRIAAERGRPARKPIRLISGSPSFPT